MCCIFTCFEWVLDMVQKGITFILGCVILVMVCAALGLAALVGTAYGYNYYVAEHRKTNLIEPDLMGARIIQGDDSTFEDLTRVNGRRLGLEDNFSNMDKDKNTTQLHKEHLTFGDGDNRTEAILRNLIEKNSYYGHGTNKLNNQPLVPQPSDTYESWWDHVANQLLFPGTKGDGPSNPSPSPVPPDIINLMPLFKTTYRPQPSKDAVYTKTRSSIITSKFSSAIYNMSRHGTTLERPITHITRSTGNARKTTSDTDQYKYINNFPSIKEKEIAHLSKDKFSMIKSTQKPTRTSKLKTTDKKTKSFINWEKDKIKTTQTNLQSALTTTTSTKEEHQSENEYNDILAIPIPAETSTTQSKRTWKNLFKSSTRKATKFKVFEKSDEEDFYKDRSNVMHFSKVRFQETTHSEEDINLRLVFRGPIIVGNNPGDDDKSDETYD